MDAAISRFDTLNKFPKVLQALGVSAEDSERAIQRLSDGIDGLPTKLDEIASTAQRMYTSVALSISSKDVYIRWAVEAISSNFVGKPSIPSDSRCIDRSESSASTPSDCNTRGN